MHSLKHRLVLWGLIGATLLLCTISAASGVPNTFGGLRRRYENQNVIVDGAEYMDRFLLEWDIAQPYGSGYKSDSMSHLPLAYKGKRARVIAVQLNPLSPAGHGGVNAMGEPVTSDDAVEPYVDIVVRFDDGRIAIKTGYPNTLEIDLASERENIAAEMEKNLPLVVGKNLYAAGWSKLYPPAATIEDLKGSTDTSIGLRVTEIPLLVPLTIEKARYVPEENAVVLKLGLPNGKEALAYTRSIYFMNDKADSTFLSRISGTLLPAMPEKLTPQDIEAVKAMKLFHGMSGDAVEYALGFAEQKNDWGTGGKQLVFFSGKLLVYLDGKERVVDWQSFE